MERFIETLIDGIATGSIYGALALALVLIYRSTGIVNFAQGEMAMFSTFGAWALTEAGLPVGLAVLVTLIASLLGGMIIERALIRPVEGSPELTLITVTLGLFIGINGLARWIWGSQNRAFPSMFGDGTVGVGGVETSLESRGRGGVQLGVVGVLWVILQKTQIGLGVGAAEAVQKGQEAQARIATTLCC